LTTLWRAASARPSQPLTRRPRAQLEEVRKLAAEAAGIAGKAQATVRPGGVIWRHLLRPPSLSQAAPVKASTAQRIGFSGAKR